MDGLPAEGHKQYDSDQAEEQGRGSTMVAPRHTWPDERLVHLLVRTRPVTLPAADALIWVSVIITASAVCSSARESFCICVSAFLRSVMSCPTSSRQAP